MLRARNFEAVVQVIRGLDILRYGRMYYQLDLDDLGFVVLHVVWCAENRTFRLCP